MASLKMPGQIRYVNHILSAMATTKEIVKKVKEPIRYLHTNKINESSHHNYM